MQKYFYTFADQKFEKKNSDKKLVNAYYTTISTKRQREIDHQIKVSSLRFLSAETRGVHQGLYNNP